MLAGRSLVARVYSPLATYSASHNTSSRSAANTGCECESLTTIPDGRIFVVLEAWRTPEDNVEQMGGNP